MLARLPRCILVCGLLLVTLFAGCVESDDAAPSAGTAATSPADGTGTGFDPGSTGPADPSASATKQAESRVKVDPNGTFIGSAHKHDWWGADTQAVIMEQNVPMGPGGVCAGAGTFACNGGAQFIRFHSSPNANERPSNVWPGTGKMEIRVRVGAVASSFMLEVAGHGGISWSKNRYEIKSADTLITLDNLNESHTDPPHFRSSGWWFRLWVGPSGASAFSGPMHITVTIFKGREPPLDPPHPDYWGLDTQRVLVDGARIWSNYTRIGAGTGTGYGAGPTPPPNATVTIGTAKLVVTLHWTNTDPTMPTKPGLSYCTPTGYCTNTPPIPIWHKPRPTSDVGNTRVYEIQVRPDEWDSPYRPATSWNFRWYFDDPNALEVGSFKGHIDWRIEIFKMTE